MIDSKIIKIINNSSSAEIEEIIDYCQEALNKKPQLKNLLQEKFEDPRYSNCHFLMLGGIYNFSDDKEVCDYCFTDMYEYEDILQRLYENSENKYNRSYATINDFADADLILSIENIEGAQVAKDFVEEIMSTREYPVTHSELECSDGGFAVIWIYNNNTKEIYTDEFDNR